jgi:predicted PurR-regulated permease PerM
VDRWIRARDRGITILIWVVVILLFFWLVSHVITTLLLFAIAALLAYALIPGSTCSSGGCLARWPSQLSICWRW